MPGEALSDVGVGDDWKMVESLEELYRYQKNVEGWSVLRTCNFGGRMRVVTE